jgi:hypothetical protein
MVIEKSNKAIVTELDGMIPETLFINTSFILISVWRFE